LSHCEKDAIDVARANSEIKILFMLFNQFKV